MPLNNEMLSGDDVAAEVSANRMFWISSVLSGLRVVTRSVWNGAVRNKGTLASDVKLCRYDEMLAHRYVNPAYATAILADSPWGYWRFNEVSGTEVLDHSGNGRHGVYTAYAVKIQEVGVAGDIYDRSIRSNSSANAAGAASVPIPPALQKAAGTPWSLELWLYRTDFSAAYWADGNDHVDNSFHIFASGNQAESKWHGNTNGSFSGGSMTVNGWNQVVVVSNGTTFDTWVNGVRNPQGPTTKGSASAAITSLKFGRSLQDRLGEAAFFNAALTSTQMAAHRSAGLNG